MSFYARLQKTAIRLIERFGAQLRFESRVAFHDPVESKDEDAQATQHLAMGVVIESERSLVDGSRIEQGRKIVLLDAQKEPQTDWVFDADHAASLHGGGLYPGVSAGALKGKWSVAEIKAIDPAGVALLYEVQISR